MRPAEFSLLPKDERARMLAWASVKDEFDGFAQIRGLFVEAGMDVDFGDWWEMDEDVRVMKIRHARKAAASRKT